MDRYRLNFVLIMLLSAFGSENLYSQYKQQDHRVPAEGEIGVNKPGSCDRGGATYVLTQDISAERSALFLGKDVTLDLNEYTLSFADANYGHVSNYGFEDGLTGWDLSKAPGAKIENTEEVHSFIGKRLLRLKAGDEIASSFVYLPVAGTIL